MFIDQSNIHLHCNSGEQMLGAPWTRCTSLESRPGGLRLESRQRQDILVTHYKLLEINFFTMCLIFSMFKIGCKNKIEIYQRTKPPIKIKLS